MADTVAFGGPCGIASSGVTANVTPFDGGAACVNSIFAVWIVSPGVLPTSTSSCVPTASPAGIFTSRFTRPRPSALTPFIGIGVPEHVVAETPVPGTKGRDGFGTGRNSSPVGLYAPVAATGSPAMVHTPPITMGAAKLGAPAVGFVPVT